MWYKVTKREQPAIKPRSMQWTKRIHGRSEILEDNTSKSEAVAKGVVEGIETRQNAFAVGEIISSVIVQNCRIFEQSTIKSNNKGRETPSLAASSHRERRPRQINGWERRCRDRAA